MHFFRHNRKMGGNHIWRYFLFLHWQKLHLQTLPTLLNCFLLVFKLWKSGLYFFHYILKMSRYTNIVYIGRYLALTYIERFISTICCFFSYICWSVNCMSWVSKFKKFFLTCTESEARFIFEDFLFFLSVKIHTHRLYWNAFSTDINGKIIFNCLLLFKAFLLVSFIFESF